MVPAGGSKLQREPAAFLAEHVGQVRAGSLVVRVIHYGRFGQRDAGDEELDELGQGADATHLHPRHQVRLRRVVGRDDDPCDRLASGGGCHGQHSPHRPHLAVEPQLTDERGATQCPQGEPTAGGEDHDSNGEIEARATLGQVGGEQVDGDASVGPLLSRVDDRRPHPVAGLV